MADRPTTEVYVSPETVADDDDPLYKEMAMLQKHIEALTLTHMGLRQQLEGAAACAEEVTRKLAQGKRCNGLAEQSSSTDDGSPFRRKKPMKRGTSTQSDRTTDTSVSSSESLPTAYRSCNLDDDDAAGDAAEFDAHVVADEGPELTYRSCEINGSFDTEEEALAAMESAYAAQDVESLRKAVATLGALAEPGVLGTLPADTAIEESLDQLTAAMKVFLL